jgi:hypothetical protein
MSFAWLHIFNFEMNLTNILWLPILTLPQLFSATIAGYTRVAFLISIPSSCAYVNKHAIPLLDVFAS